MHLGNRRIMPHKYMDSCFRIRPSSAKQALEFNAKCLLSRLYWCQTQLWHFVEISLEPKISHLIRRPCVLSAFPSSFQENRKTARSSWTTGNFSQERSQKNVWECVWLYLKCGSGVEPRAGCSARGKRWSFHHAHLALKKLIPNWMSVV